MSSVFTLGTRSSSSKSSLNDTLSALREVIISQQDDNDQHEPSATEYFALLVATIGTSTQTEHLLEILTILDAVLPQSSVNVVKSQFTLLANSLIKIAKALTSSYGDGSGGSSTGDKLLRKILDCIGNSLLLQDLTEGFWGSVIALQSVNALLTFIDDTRTKVRKSAQDRLFSLLSLHKRGNVRSVRTYVADFCIGVLKSCTRSEYKRSIFILMFCELSLTSLYDNSVLQIFEHALRLQECEQPMLTSAVFRMIDTFFQNPTFHLATDSTSQCLHMVLLHRPNTKDMEANTYFCTCIASGLINLHKRDVNLASQALPLCIQPLVDECDTEFSQIHVAVATAIRRIFTECIDDALLNKTLKLLSMPSNSSVRKEIQADPLLVSLTYLELLCQLRYQNSWIYVMDGVKSLFDRFKGDVAVMLLQSFILKVVEIGQAIDSGIVQVVGGITTSIYDMIGSILRCVGIVNFLSLIPLHSTASPDYIGIDQSKEWVLTILHSNLKLMSCKLSDFHTDILPRATKCSHAIASPHTYNITDSNQIFNIRNRVIQFWSLFPDFCALNVTDTRQSLPSLLQVLDLALKDSTYPEIHPFIIGGLTHIATNSRAKCPGLHTENPDIVVLKQLSQTVFPTLLTILESIDICNNQFQSLVHCITAWASVSPPQLITSIAKKLLQLLLTSTADMSQDTHENAVTSGWIALLQAIIPFLPEQMVEILYRSIRPLLTVDTSASLQKRSYSVLDSLLKTHGTVLYRSESSASILLAVSDSILTCHVSARSMRLRCMSNLLSTMDDDEVTEAAASILGEVLICLKDSNKKSRDCAMDLMKTMVSRVPSSELMTKLCSALVAETAIMKSSAIIGICLLLFEHRHDHGLLLFAVQLLPTLCLLLQEESTELTKAVLSYIRVCSSILPYDMLNEELLRQVIHSFTSGLGVLKSKFSSRARSIMRKLSQRLGADTIRPYIPDDDLALLGYIQKQMRRSERRKASKEQEQDRIEQMLNSDGDDDSDDDDAIGNNAIESRLSSRPKATKSKDYIDSNAGTLDSLMEDQTPSFVVNSHGSVSKNRTAFNRSNTSIPDDEDEDYRVVIRKDGRIAVEERVEGSATGGKVGNKRTLAAVGNDNNEDDANDAAKNNFTNVQVKAPVKQRQPGEEYRSKKSGGDVWKRGMLEPHAFIPLDPRMLNKKSFDIAVKHFGGVVKGSKNIKQSTTTANKNATMGNRRQRASAKEHIRKQKEDDFHQSQQQQLSMEAAAKKDVNKDSNKYGKTKFSNSGDGYKRPKVDGTVIFK